MNGGEPLFLYLHETSVLRERASRPPCNFDEGKPWHLWIALRRRPPVYLSPYFLSDFCPSFPFFA